MTESQEWELVEAESPPTTRAESFYSETALSQKYGCVTKYEKCHLEGDVVEVRFNLKINSINAFASKLQHVYDPLRRLEDAYNGIYTNLGELKKGEMNVKYFDGESGMYLGSDRAEAARSANSVAMALMQIGKFSHAKKWYYKAKVTTDVATDQEIFSRSYGLAMTLPEDDPDFQLN